MDRPDGRGIYPRCLSRVDCRFLVRIADLGWGACATAPVVRGMGATAPVVRGMGATTPKKGHAARALARSYVSRRERGLDHQMAC